MPKPWNLVENSDEYNSLSEIQQVNAKKQYFNEVISMKEAFYTLPIENRKEAKEQFFGGKLPEDDEIEDVNVPLETVKGRLELLLEVLSKLYKNPIIKDTHVLIEQRTNLDTDKQPAFI